MDRFDHTTSNAPAGTSFGCVADPLEVVPVEAFKNWTKQDLKDEIKRQSAEGPLCLYVCSATVPMLGHDMNPEPIEGGGMIALDETMPAGVIRYDHGERQRALGLPIVHYFAAEVTP